MFKCYLQFLLVKTSQNHTDRAVIFYFCYAPHVRKSAFLDFLKTADAECGVGGWIKRR